MTTAGDQGEQSASRCASFHGKFAIFIRTGIRGCLPQLQTIVQGKTEESFS